MTKYKIITAVPTTSADKLPSVYLGELHYFIQERRNYGYNREININHTRHLLQQSLKDCDADLVLLMDSDVVVTENDLKILLDSFDGKNPICIDTKPKFWDREHHVCCACCLMRFEDWQKIDYIDTFVDECQCSKIRELYPQVSYCNGIKGYELKKKNSVQIVDKLFNEVTE